MSMPFRARSKILMKAGAALLGLAIGIGLAFVITRLWPPLERYDPTPNALRQDYRDEYIRLVALSYQVDGDLGAATDRLGLLQGEDATQPLLALLSRWIEEGRSPQLIAPLAALARDLGAESPALIEFEKLSSP